MRAGMGSIRARHAAAGALAAVAAWLAFYAGWLLLAPGGERGLLIFGDTVYLVPIAAAALLAAWAARRAPRGLRGFWALVSLAGLSWAAGEVLWAVSELGTGSVPFPWWTDVAYLGFYAVMLVALVVFFRPSLRAVGVQALLDGTLTVAAVALLWWWLVLADVEIGFDLASLVGLGYPVLGLLLLGVIAMTPLVSARRGTASGWLVAAGVAAGAIADGVYAGLVLRDGYVSGMWVDLGWQAEASLIAAAAALSGLGGADRADWAQRRSPLRVRTAVSMSAALVAVVAVLVVDGVRGTLSNETVAFACAVAALLLVRGWALLLAASRNSARRDPLTGVYDEPHLHDQLRRLAAAARQYDEPFALVLLRVPRRSETDALHRLVRTVRELDLVAHLAEGNPAIVLPRTGEAGAADAAERLRVAARCPAAAGVAVWMPGDTADDLLGRARTLLDAAVRLGGNHTRGPAPDVLVHGHDRLGATALCQLRDLAFAVDMRYAIAPAHSRKVARLSRDLALALELDDGAVTSCYVAGLLHALGTMPLDEAALHPHGAFTALDAKLELRHGSRGAELVRRIPCAAHVAPIVGAFEEHWDGSGPRRVRGESIPFEARIVAVANSITTMTEPDGDALGLTSALSEIWRLAGGRFDPEVVSALFRLVRDGRIAEALEDEESSVRV